MLTRNHLKEAILTTLRFLFGIVVFSLMYVPVAIIIYQSFNAGANSISPLSWGGFTWENYAAMFTNRQLYTSILDSLLVSLWATAISTVFGLFASIGIHALSKKARKSMDFLNEIPMLNSEIVTGISIMLVCSLLKPLFPNIFGFWSMLLAHVFFCVPYVILMVLPKLEQTDESLFEAAQDLGCSPWKSLVKVIIPSLSTAILTGALVAFTLSIDDFVISFYTQGNGFSNFSNYVYSSYTKKNFSAGSYAFNALLTFMTLGLVLTVSLVSSHKKGKRTKA
ncbi:MAG: ABC transporter permease [Erysipelotrichaceae bacterium]|nr:ABC transporter permease [Erysipelotrichaceae bacterium]